MNIYKEIKSLSEGEIPDYTNSLGDINSLLTIFESVMSDLYLARINYQSVGSTFTNLLLNVIYEIECVIYEIDKFECLVQSCWFYKKKDWSYNGVYKFVSFCDDMIGFCEEKISSLKNWDESFNLLRDDINEVRSEIKKESADEEKKILKEQVTVATVKEASDTGKIPHTPSQTDFSAGDSDAAKSTINLTNTIAASTKQSQEIQKLIALNSNRISIGPNFSEMNQRLSALNSDNKEYLMYNDISHLNTSLNNLLAMRRTSQSRSVVIAGLILTGLSIVAGGIVKMMENAKSNHEDNQEAQADAFDKLKSDSCTFMIAIKTSLSRVLNETYNWLESCELDVAWWAAVKNKIQMSHLTRYTLHVFRICMIDHQNGIFGVYTMKNFITLMNANSKFMNKSSMISNLRFNIISNLIKFSYSDGNVQSIDYCSMFELCRFFFYIFHSLMRICCSFYHGQLVSKDTPITVDVALDSKIFGECKYSDMEYKFEEFIDEIIGSSILCGRDVVLFFEKMYSYIRRGVFQ